MHFVRSGKSREGIGALDTLSRLIPDDKIPLRELATNAREIVPIESLDKSNDVTHGEGRPARPEGFEDGPANIFFLLRQVRIGQTTCNGIDRFGEGHVVSHSEFCLPRRQEPFITLEAEYRPKCAQRCLPPSRVPAPGSVVPACPPPGNTDCDPAVSW